jgi:hypothetical protein
LARSGEDGAMTPTSSYSSNLDLLVRESEMMGMGRRRREEEEEMRCQGDITAAVDGQPSNL